MCRKLVLIFTLIFHFFLRCDLYAQFHLKKIKGFGIETLNSVEIADYHRISKRFVALESGMKGYVVFLLDEKGEIISKKNVSGQGPGQINGALNGLGFSPDGGIWIMSLAHVIYYDQKLNFQKQEKFSSKINMSMYGNANLIPFYFRNNQVKDVVFATFPSGGRMFSQSQNLYSEHLLELYDTTNKKNYHLGSLKDRSIGHKLDKSLNFVFFPIYSIDKVKSHAFVTGSLDDEITVIDVQTGETKSRINVNHGEFKILSLSKLNLNNLPKSEINTLTAINHKLLHLDDGLLVLDYILEIPESVFKRKKIFDRYYHHFQDPEYHRLIVFDHTKQLSGDIPMPKNGHLMISLPENRLLFKIVDPELEEDFLRYEIYQIVKN